MVRKLTVTNSALYKIYITELYELALSIDSKIKVLFDKTILPKEGHSCNYSKDCLDLINEILIKAANIKRLVKGASYQNRNEKNDVYLLRKQRESLFRDLLKGIDMSLIFSVKLRNTLEHLEEYLDVENFNIRQGKRKHIKYFAYNRVISHWSMINVPSIPVKVYVASEYTFYNLDWSVNILELKKTVSEIHQTLDMKGVNHFSDDPFFISGLIKIK